MASLKEIRSRIGSVKSTQKITSAMKMISSSKLRKAQMAITNFLPYQQKLDAILTNLLASDVSYDSPFTQQREVKRTAIVVFSSNSSLCGAFNANVIKEFKAEYDKKKYLGDENILIYPVGKKVQDAVKKAGLKFQGDYTALAEKPSFQQVQDLAKELIAKYVSKEIDEVKVIYYHFVSTGSQALKTSLYLPFDLSKNNEANVDKGYQTDYILEPSKEEILESLIPTVLYSRLYAVLLDSNASEHAARMMAMQVATDNANDLIQDLTQEYNKSRQQAVTNELLDIIGGASALQG